MSDILDTIQNMDDMSNNSTTLIATGASDAVTDLSYSRYSTARNSCRRLARYGYYWSSYSHRCLRHHVELAEDGLIGGCAGTQMGCCEDGLTQATMENGCEQSNMDDNAPVASPISLASSTTCTTVQSACASAESYPEGSTCTESSDGSSSTVCTTVDGPCADASSYPEGTTCTENGGSFPIMWVVLAGIVGATAYMFFAKKGCFAPKEGLEGGVVENKKAVKQTLKNVLAKNNNKETLV